MTFEEMLHFADRGNSSIQNFLAMAINANTNYPDRLVEAYKWVCISHMMGDSLSPFELSSFLSGGLTKEETDRAHALVDEWWERKTLEAHDEDTDPMSINWFQKLEDMTGLTERKARVMQEREALSREELSLVMSKLVGKVKAQYAGLPLDDLDLL